MTSIRPSSVIKSEKAETEAQPAVERLAQTLNTTYRVSVTDGRTFTGQFVCIDPQGHIVLDKCVETMAGTSGDREVGLVLVPQRHWVKVERDTTGDSSPANADGDSCLAV
ncbi:hypothetical protein T439DRAFT_170051 [Meredithblackwellia eburnea MCA 4105]